MRASNRTMLRMLTPISKKTPTRRRAKPLDLDRPQAEIDSDGIKSPTLSNLSSLMKNNVCEASQCNKPLTALTGIAHLKGNCRK